MYYPCQKQLVIHREAVKKTNGRVFLCVYSDNLLSACRELSGSAFKTYVYLLTNRDGFGLEYSPTAISAATKLSLETIRRNFKEMEEKKFIIPADGSKTLFNFYEVHKPNITLSVEKRTFVDSETGEIYDLSYSDLVNVVGEYDAKTMWEAAKDVKTNEE